MIAKNSKFLLPLLIAGWILVITGFLARAEVPSVPDLGKLMEGASKERSLTIYHSTLYEDTKILTDNFLRKYPFIKLHTYRAGQVALINRIMSEHRAQAQKWDVIILNTLLLNDLKKQEALQRYLIRDASAYDGGFRDNEGFWYGLLINAQVLGYNTRIVKSADIPRSFMDLLDPKWIGKIAIDAEPYDWLMCLEKQWGREKTWNYIKNLSQQRPKVLRGRGLLTQLLAAGEIPLSIPLYNYRIEQMKKDRAPVDWVALDPVSANITGIALSEKPSNPSAARLFLEYTLSREGQHDVRELGRIPARLEIKPNPPRLTENLKMIPSEQNQPDDIKRVLRDFNAYMRNK